MEIVNKITLFGEIVSLEQGLHSQTSGMCEREMVGQEGLESTPNGFELL